MALLRHMTLVRSALVYKSRRLATRIDNPPGGRKRPLEKGVAMSLSEKSRDRLTAVSTATLPTVLFKRGFRNTFIQGIPQIARRPFPAYHAAAAAPTNLIKHHAVDLDVPIACGEVPVYPGDIVVGDD